MSGFDGAEERIVGEVTSWPGVESGPGRRGELSLRLGIREIGHLHGDHAAHFGLPKSMFTELHEAGRLDFHPVFPGQPGFGARRIDSEADVEDVIAIMRRNYDRIVERHGIPDSPSAVGNAPPGQ